MSYLSGSNLSDIRSQNRALILKLVATENFVSRVDLARMTGLTKTTASKIVSELMAENIICETQIDMPTSSLGRKPIYLDISPLSPCVCGMLIKRGLCSVVLSDYKGSILCRRDYEYTHSVSADELIDILLDLYKKLAVLQDRKILAVGISAIGPVDTAKQELANPPNFNDISNLPLPEIISKATGLPAFIINDANAGALAEKVYGRGKKLEDFIYLHIASGIGAGYILKNQIYSGSVGKSGEIGHTSINFAGPVCDCGNIGCLETYANLNNINAKIRHMRKVFPSRSVLAEKALPYTWKEIISAAESADFFAISALDEFCDYVSYALANTINLLDVNHVIVGYDSSPTQTTIETILSEKLNSHVLAAKYRSIVVEKSFFCGDAPLIGSVAMITNQLFNGE